MLLSYLRFTHFSRDNVRWSQLSVLFDEATAWCFFPWCNLVHTYDAFTNDGNLLKHWIAVFSSQVLDKKHATEIFSLEIVILSRRGSGFWLLVNGNSTFIRSCMIMRYFLLIFNIKGFYFSLFLLSPIWYDYMSM
jgi:hypothetical protein